MLHTYYVLLHTRTTTCYVLCIDTNAVRLHQLCNTKRRHYYIDGAAKCMQGPHHDAVDWLYVAIGTMPTRAAEASGYLVAASYVYGLACA